MGYKKFSFEDLDHQTIKITFNDPGTANSFGIDAASELNLINKTILGRLSKIKVIIFTGSDRFFCSGGNLKEYRNLSDKISGIKINRRILNALKTFRALPIAKIALVNGDCFGGGIELLSCFDFIFSQPEALFGFWQSRQSLTFGWGGFSRLTNRFLPGEIQRFLLQSHTLSAYEAFRIGLIDQVSSRPEIWSVTLQLSVQLAKNSDNYLLTKRLSAKNELKVFSKLWWSQSHQTNLHRR